MITHHKKMTKYKNKYRIEPNRWQFWDYSAPGRYFLTVCIQDMECILGNVMNKKMVLSEFGNIVETEINEIPTYHPRIILDEWKVMPNHIHLIIELGEYNYNNGIADDNGNDNVDKIHEFYLRYRDCYQPTIDEIKQYRKLRRRMLIPKILGKLQMKTSKEINQIQKTPGHKNWQSDYHDHIIRDDASYHRIKNYIINNPKKWEEEKFNADNPVKKNHDFSPKNNGGAAL